MRSVEQFWTGETHGMLSKKNQESFAYFAEVPELLSELSYNIPVPVLVALEEAAKAVASLQADFKQSVSFEALARLLVRSEGINSSKIEGLSLGHRRLSEALFAPEHSRGTEKAVAANVVALEKALQLATPIKPFDLPFLLEVHSLLLDSTKPEIAGKLRAEPVWIGPNPTPRNARFIAPPHEEIPVLLDDLFSYCNRKDINPIEQAAIAHAQFEAIHPFADGNGRVGRCLIHAILKYREVSITFAPPVSVVLATHEDEYIEGLNFFRDGQLTPWIELFARATQASAQGSRALFKSIETLQAEWYEQTGHPRANSTALRLIQRLPGIPIVDVASISKDLEVTFAAANKGIAQLEACDILRPLREDAKRDRRWIASQVLGLLDAFEADLTIQVPKVAAKVKRRAAPSATQRSLARLAAEKEQELSF